MEHRRQTAGTIALFCCLVSFLARVADANDGTGRLVQLPPSDSTGPQQLCQDLCGECQCSGQLVGENVCLCNCDFPSASAGGSNCTVKVKRLCQQLDVECNFNGPEITYVRAGRGCHSMSCYEKEHGYGEGHEGYYGADEEGGEYGEGYGAPGAKELICCKDKKHKEKKHKHKPKKHHKKEKHTKFHIIIKGKMPEPQCHHEGGGDYDGGYDEYEGYRAVAPENRHPSSSFGGHVPMEVTVWKNGKKQPVRKPSHQQQHQHQQPPPHYAHPAPSPESGPRGKSSEPSLPPPPPPRERPPQEQPPQRPHPPTPAEPEMPPEEPLTPPPNLFDGAPITPDRRPPAPEEPPKPHTTQSPPPPPAPKAPPPPPSVFLRPAPPPPPPPPPSFYRPAPPPPPPPAPRRMEASRSYDEPSYSSCQFESYDLNYFHPPQFYSAPPPSPPPPPPPPSPPASSSFYRSYSPSFDPYTSSYYQPQYETPEHYPYDYDEPASYREHDDSPGYPAGPPSHGHGVHPLSDDEVEDWAPPPVRDPADTLAFNQIVSRQIWQNERAILYSTPPFQPTPRPLRDEFEPPVAEIGPVQYEAGGSGEKNYYQEFPLAPPADAFIPPVPAPDSPVEFPTAEHMPAAYPGNSEEAQYRPPTPPPHYVRMKGVGRMSSFGYDRPSHGSGGGYRSASHGRTGPSQQWVSASGRRF